MSLAKKNISDELFAIRMLTRFAHGLLRDGDLKIEGKSDDELYEEILNAFDEFTRQDFQFVIDHTGDILQYARSFKSLRKNNLAVLFYALWFEHQLNGIVVSLAQRKKLPDKEIDALIRETSYRAKCSWLLRILGISPLSISHANTISRLMEMRNAFVHYKWKSDNEQVRSEIEAVLGQIEKTVKYVRTFENKNLYTHQKRKLHKVVKEKRQN